MWRMIPLVVAAFAVAGCFPMTYQFETGDPDSVQLTAPKGARLVKHISVDRVTFFLLGGLVPLTQVDVGTLLKPHLEQGHRVANLRVRSQVFLDLILFSVGGLTVEGDEVVSR